MQEAHLRAEQKHQHKWSQRFEAEVRCGRAETQTASDISQDPPTSDDVQRCAREPHHLGRKESGDSVVLLKAPLRSPGGEAKTVPTSSTVPQMGEVKGLEFPGWCGGSGPCSLTQVCNAAGLKPPPPGRDGRVTECHVQDEAMGASNQASTAKTDGFQTPFLEPRGQNSSQNSSFQPPDLESTMGGLGGAHANPGGWPCVQQHLGTIRFKGKSQ